MNAPRGKLLGLFTGCWILGLALVSAQESTPRAILFKVVSMATQISTVQGDPARLKRLQSAKMPALTRSISFDTPEADALCSALEVFPPDNAWNLVVDHWPLHPNSKKIVASIGADKPLRYNDDMGFVLIPAGQKKVEVKIVSYPDESDHGPFPVPDDIPIEGWPSNYVRRKGGDKITLEEVQRDRLKENGDRHAIVVGSCRHFASMQCINRLG